jgi:preprotein translocase subunit SecG
MQPLVVVLHVLACISLIGLVLLQQGKGAEIGAAFGGGASNTLFGSPGASSFLFKLTAVIGAIFFGAALLLNYMGTTAKHKSVLPLPTSQTQQNSAPVPPSDL